MEDNTNFEIDIELLAGFVDEAEEELAKLDCLFVKLESDAQDLNTINTIFRPIHTIKGNSAFFGLMKIKKLAHEMETLLSLAKEEKLNLEQSNIDILLEGLDQLREMLSRTRNGENETISEADFNDLIDRITSAKTTGNNTQEVSSSTQETRSQNKKAGEKINNSKEIAGAEETHKTMRVTEDSIDNFLDSVGELIVVSEMYKYLQQKISKRNLDKNIVSDFRRINQTFNELSDKLQKSIMSIRKVSVGTVLQKAPRIVRDIAAKTGKQIKVRLTGEEIGIDKRLVEILDGPITHMVRNSADHGIELPEEREVAGKPKEGVINISVTETSDDCYLTISDDGKGLDLEAIKAKAVKLGFIGDEDELTEDQLVDMIFFSGVSTAKQVTDVSGRGVGMDVVNRNIAAANGKITVKTAAGKGCEFIIRLPKTVSTQIIDGFLVGLNDNHYVIPMDNVQEAFSPAANDISSIVGKCKQVLRHGELFPVIRLSDVFNYQGGSDKSDMDQIMVSINTGKNKMVLQVDKVLGVQKVVLKELSGLELHSEIYSAGAVMGDGTIAMALDVEKLLSIANIKVPV